MQYSEKIKVILEKTQKTQLELAVVFSVSHPSLHAWLHNKSIPRKNKQILIDALFEKTTGATKIDSSILDILSKKVAACAVRNPSPLHILNTRGDLYEIFVTAFTYHTNTIESSTLSLAETDSVIFHNALIKNKTLIEQQEAKNHRQCIDYMLRFVITRSPITHEYVQKLHAILMNGIYDYAGAYRNHSVRTGHSQVVTSNYVSIPAHLDAWFQKYGVNTPLSELAKSHARFEQIHPFPDGNGRVGRLLMCTQLLQQNIFPALVEKELKHAYYKYLQSAQTEEVYAPLSAFLYEAILASYKLMD